LLKNKTSILIRFFLHITKESVTASIGMKRTVDIRMGAERVLVNN